MNVCADCFNENEIRQFVLDSSKEKGFCDCSKQEASVVDISILSDFLIEFLNLFAFDNEGENLIEIVQKDWGFFKSNEYAEVILGEVINENDFAFSVSDKVSYIPEIKECIEVWLKLKTEVKESKRFFSDLGTFDWANYVRTNLKIKKNTVLYRARLIPEGISKLSCSEMGCPPKEKASAGRVNPMGIPYLYLCEKKETTYYEIRSVYLDRICVGKFSVERDLRIVDFSKSVDIFKDDYDILIEMVKRKILFKEISADLSKPLRRFDTEIEYVPTQLICEYCKINGADGVRSNSSLHKEGVNIVLFNEADATCKCVSDLNIENVEISIYP